MSDATITLQLKVWRQPASDQPGAFETYEVKDISPHISFLEMLDALNEDLIAAGKEPVAFDHDCREGICGSCGFAIDGRPHGPDRGTTVCQLHMRRFTDGQTLTLEPWRARAFPVLKDLMVDRTAFDRIQQAGGYASVNCGNAPDANAMLVGRDDASAAFDAAACIGCGACVAACKNASASLFVAAKIGHFAMLPQGQPERDRRAVRMVAQMDDEGFGACTNTLECEAACPKEISVSWIQKMNREYTRATLRGTEA